MGSPGIGWQQVASWIVAFSLPSMTIVPWVGASWSTA